MACSLLLCLILTDNFSPSSCAEASIGEACTPASLKNALLQFKPEERAENAVKLYNQCQKDFLSRNQLSRSVKDTVDKWLGFDLETASVEDRFKAYQQTLTRPKLADQSDGFQIGCIRMIESYQLYQDSMEVLSSSITSEMISEMLTEEVDSEDMKLLNYGNYAQMCSGLMD